MEGDGWAGCGSLAKSLCGVKYWEQWVSGVRMRNPFGWGGAQWPGWWVRRGRELGVRSAAGDRQRGCGFKMLTQKANTSLSLSLLLFKQLLRRWLTFPPLAVQCNPASASTKCRDFVLNGTSQVATTRPHLTSRYPRQGVVLSCYHVLTRPRHI